MGQVRIIGGVHRSRVIKFKDGIAGLRPTPNIMRERLFNWLEQDLKNKKCLDLFAGSGALGFEAVSRNAKQVIMLEIDRNSVKDLASNKILLKADNLVLLNYSALKYLESCSEKFDIIFVDPPYDSELLGKSLELIMQKHETLLNKDAVVYIEYHDKPDLAGWEIIKESKSGFVNSALLGIK